MHPSFRAPRGARRFFRSRGGNVAMIWALCATAIIGLVGLSVDFARAQALRSEMQNAADGAALVAQRNATRPFNERLTAARAYFDETLGTQAGTAAPVFELVPLTTATSALAGHRVNVSIDLRTGLSRVLDLIVGRDHSKFTVAVRSEATSMVSPPIEMVLALDNTGSMSNDMAALRTAAAQLVNDTYDLAISHTDISIGIVPFVAQVNIGNGATQLGWMDTAGTSPLHAELLEGRQIGWKAMSNSTTNCNSLNVATTQLPFSGYTGTYRINWVFQNQSGNRRCLAYTPDQINYFTLFNYINVQWKGCVEARPEPWDITDDPPTTADTRFTPYFWVDGEDNDYLSAAAITSTGSVSMSYLGGSTSTTDDNGQRADTFNVFKYRGSPSVDTTPPTTTGPNMGCPTPITPLTTASGRNTVITAVNAMQHWNGGGTDQVEGLVWGWRVLSPGQPFGPNGDGIPRPYNVAGQDPVARKVLVLMTDGENTNLSDSTVLGSDYSAYGHLAQWTSNVNSGVRGTWSGTPANGFATGVTVGSTTYGALPSAYRRPITSTASYVSRIDTREAQLCTNIKNTGIEVYTVVFREPSATIRQMLRDCATQPAATHAFTADNGAELSAVFQAIGQGVGQLRLTR